MADHEHVESIRAELRRVVESMPAELAQSKTFTAWAVEHIDDQARLDASSLQLFNQIALAMAGLERRLAILELRIQKAGLGEPPASS